MRKCIARFVGLGGDFLEFGGGGPGIAHRASRPTQTPTQLTRHEAVPDRIGVLAAPFGERTGNGRIARRVCG